MIDIIGIKSKAILEKSDLLEQCKSDKLFVVFENAGNSTDVQYEIKGIGELQNFNDENIILKTRRDSMLIVNMGIDEVQAGYWIINETTAQEFIDTYKVRFY